MAQHKLHNPDFLAWHQPDLPNYALASAVFLDVMGLLLAPVLALVMAGIVGMVGIAGSWLGRTSGRV